jgi:hypothetical protein
MPLMQLSCPLGDFYCIIIPNTNTSKVDGYSAIPGMAVGLNQQSAYRLYRVLPQQNSHRPRPSCPWVHPCCADRLHGDPPKISGATSGNIGFHKLEKRPGRQSGGLAEPLMWNQSEMFRSATPRSESKLQRKLRKGHRQIVLCMNSAEYVGPSVRPAPGASVLLVHGARNALREGQASIVEPEFNVRIYNKLSDGESARWIRSIICGSSLAWLPGNIIG